VPDPRASTDLDPSSTSISTAALDEPAFEAEPYITSLLATSNLKTVLKVEATLISEIRNLDGERKALVYDNYSKLIKATRTIGGIRMNMNGEERSVGGRGGGGGGGERRSGGLSEHGMRDLGERLEGVRKLAEELGRGGVEGEGQGQGERRKVKEEHEKRQLVRWVLDGPRRLRKRVEDGQMQEAEAGWKVLSGLLDKWESVKGAQETRKACEEVLHDTEAEGEKNGAG
jgi:vacuolar protein sorting-associated protein 51